MIFNLVAILNEGESYTVEFKERPDNDLPEEVCAFANASGGKVYIGIHDEGYVVGTNTSNSARSRIQDTINKVEPRLFVSMDVVDNIIATLLNRCDYIEQMGTGIERMKDATREANVSEPEFEFSGFFKVIFKRNEPDIPIDRQSAVNRPKSMPNGIDGGINNGIDNGIDNDIEKNI